MSRRLKVATYNVHGCVGGDRRLDPARIVRVIEACDADIVGLQELDVGRARSGGADQAEIIAAGLRMKSLFHPAIHSAEEKYGDAILTALPMRTVRTGELPGGSGEPRGAIWTEVTVGGRPIQVFNTHLGLSRRERRAQVETLLGKDWLGHPECRDADAILVGDFNSVPLSWAYRALARRLTRVRTGSSKRIAATFPARYPFLRLDHIFLSGDLRCVETATDRSDLARVASDHLPLTATLELI